ncbi:MAG: hypothetical protein WAV18_06915 [Roseiarcus sp.]
MSEDTWFLGVVPKIAGDLVSVPTEETTLQAIVSGEGGGSGGSSSQSVGAANLATNQVTVGVTATLLAAARTGVAGTGRIAITILNNGTVTIYLGGSSVLVTTGIQLPAGDAITLNTTAALYAISGTAGQNVGIAETF